MRRLHSTLLVLLFLILSHASVYAQSPFPTYSGGTPDPTFGPPPATLGDLEVVFARIIAFSTTLAILAFFIMFVVASFKYLTSGGDQKATESARNTMTYAIIGILVVVGAYIAMALLEGFIGIPLTIFSIAK